MSAWQFVVVTLGAYRLWRIAARDTITEPVREAVTGYDDDEAPGLTDAPRKTWRIYVSGLVRCPWCLGFWISLAVYGAWLLWPHATFYALTPFAISAALGIVRKTLDP